MDTAEILTEVHGQIGCITLNRPKALNALSLGMVRGLHAALRQWEADPEVLAIAIRGSNKEGPFGAFCAGGDIRFLYQAAKQGDPRVEDFFTEEYILNHLTHHLKKPYIAFMDGVVMGGGMGISQGASLRIVTERTRMAMPETGIGLFPDVGGGYFLSRCPGHAGEWLALTGETINAGDAVAVKLADVVLPSDQLPALWDALGAQTFADGAAVERWIAAQGIAASADHASDMARINRYFSLPDVPAIIAALEAAEGAWEQATAALLRQRSPLMLYVALEQIRRARGMTVAEDLRMERDLMRHCFHLRPGQSETLEGVRALAVDKDRKPQWNPARIEAVDPQLVQAFFASPWPQALHPLAGLA
ncbi:enoyl-CoA hydratase/isomerase family protein [Comamonas badia]|uniref:enoyl-CoA hydratase/isomerase family protein n=1 Tax=Comamonas badia TaxID=265291 RepID=UPI00041C9A92|nr:enoyl-CoA hydratase/isomerase family protein [Comamonas badia]